MRGTTQKRMEKEDTKTKTLTMEDRMEAKFAAIVEARMKPAELRAPVDPPPWLNKEVKTHLLIKMYLYKYNQV